MTTISFFPVVGDESQLSDVLSRAAWFFANSAVDRICIPVAIEELKSAKWRVAPGMDLAIAGNFDRLRSKVEFVVARTAADLDACMKQASIILHWRKDTASGLVSAERLAIWQQDKKVWQVDPVAVRMEGSFYIDAALYLVSDKEALIEENRAKFNKLSEKLGKFERAYLMATGPSVASYKNFDYTNALSIVCNSVILDEELMDAVRPQILVFADPIFHFGPSQYAASFRAKLLESSRKHDYTICIPFKYYPLFVSIMPELADRTIGIPFVKDREFNFDLTKDFQLKTTANILTFLMVPLAATFADEIGILGCDGRPLKENTYFWKHNQNTQFSDKMENIREIHPGFFNIDYNDYYLDHCLVLKQQLSEGERIGRTFICHGFSYIPALRARLGIAAPSELCRDKENQSENYPRLLVICLTNMGGYSATSRIKEAFFESWPTDKFRHVYVNENARKFLIFSDKSGERFVAETGDDEVLSAIIDYNPEVVYYRAVDNKLVHELAVRLVADQIAPLVIHLMDDWPARLSKINPEELYFFDKSLRLMLDSATYRLSIGHRMSDAFKVRYGLDFLPFANAVDPASFPCRTRRRGPGDPFVIRYAGALADDMTFGSVIEFAEAIESLSTELNVRLEIYTRYPWKERAEDRLSGLKSVSIFNQVPPSDYFSLLGNADALLIAYNFDEGSQAYIRYSIANKLPEYLGSGTPIIAYGPRNVATIDYAIDSGCIYVINEQNPQLLREGIRELVNSPELQNRLGEAGRSIAISRHNVWNVRANLHQLLIDAAKTSKRTLIGPYRRKASAHWDETSAIAVLFSEALTGATMIDVGAHHGSALSHFLDKEWKIFAFEPDAANRRRLEDRLVKHQASRVRIDARAVSNEHREGMPFYVSEVSTGISSLSPFHTSHRKAQEVDTVTLQEALAGEMLSSIDFLKIDTEGHDLLVLKGFPWERFKPAVIECEFEDSKTVPLGYTFHDLAKFLVEKGYTVYVSEWHPVIRYGIRHDWNRLTRYPCELSESRAWGNLLAFRDPIDEATLVAAAKRVMKFGATPAAAAAPVAENAPILPTPVTPKAPVAPGSTNTVLSSSSSAPDAAKSGSATTAPTAVVPDKHSTPQPILKEDHIVRMDKPPVGDNWHRPERHAQWGNFCWTGPGARSTLNIPMRRDRELLAVVAYYRPLIKEQLTGLRVEVDGVIVHHWLRTDLSPERIVARIPPRSTQSREATELALVVPHAVAPSSLLSRSTDHRLVGLGIISVSTMPADSAPALEFLSKGVLPRGRNEALLKPTLAPTRPASPSDLTERVFVRLDKLPAGENWRPADKNEEWSAYCSSVPGKRSTLRFPLKRDRETLLVVAYYKPFTQSALKRLSIEVDGVTVSYWVRSDIRPKCIVARVPPRSNVDDSLTEIAIVAPPPEGASAQQATGLGVIWVSMVPMLSIQKPPSRAIGRSLIPRLPILQGSMRLPHDFPLSHFDGLAYMKSYPDVAEAVIAGQMPSALEHYRRHGIRENRRFALAAAGTPNEGGVSHLFDGLAYLDTYPEAADMVRSGMVSSALEHYLTHGRALGYGIRARMDGKHCSGSAADLARKDTAREARAEIEALKSRLSAETSQQHARLAKVESAVPGLARTSDLDAARAESRNTTGKLESLKGELGRIEKLMRDTAIQLKADTTARENSLAGQVDAVRLQLADALRTLSTVARASDVEQARLETARNVEQIRKEVAETAAREQSLLAQIDLFRSDLSEARQHLAATARADDLVRLQQEALRQFDQLRREIASSAATRETREQAMASQVDALKASLARAQEGLASTARTSDLEHLKRDARRDLEEIRDEIATALTMREAREQAVLEQIDLLRINLDEAQRRLAGTSRADELEHLRRNMMLDFDRVRSELASASSVVSAREQALLAQVDSLRAEIGTAKSRADLAEVKAAFVQQELGAGAQQVAGSLSEIQARLAAEQAEVARLQTELEAVRTEAAATSARVSHANLDTFNVLGYQSHPRALVRASAERLAKHWAPMLGLNIQERELYYLAHRASALENGCIGRLAAPVNDILLRILVARAVKSRRPEILEIGTLFGLGVGILHEAVAPLFERVHFTVIDPLEGYYGKENRDVLTGVPVTRAAFDENLRRMGVAGDRIRLIQALSTDPKAVKQAKKKRYDVAIIDGDHSYAGVKHDSENYLGMVKPGGYVIFDDYDNNAWPGVKQYVDAKIMPRADLRFVGAEWHTAVFQVTG